MTGSPLLDALYDERAAIYADVRETHGGRGCLDLSSEAKEARVPLYAELDEINREIFAERRRLAERARDEAEDGIERVSAE